MLSRRLQSAGPLPGSPAERQARLDNDIAQMMALLLMLLLLTKD